MDYTLTELYTVYMQLQRTKRFRNGTTAGVEIQVERCDGTGHDACSRSACLHAGHHCPGLGLWTVHLGRVEIGLTVMAADGKQIATESSKSNATATDVHRLNKFPSVSLRIIPEQVVRKFYCITVKLVCFEAQNSKGSEHCILYQLHVYNIIIRIYM